MERAYKNLEEIRNVLKANNYNEGFRIEEKEFEYIRDRYHRLCFDNNVIQEVVVIYKQGEYEVYFLLQSRKSENLVHYGYNKLSFKKLKEKVAQGIFLNNSK